MQASMSVRQKNLRNVAPVHWPAMVTLRDQTPTPGMDYLEA
jgi:hypothetical protein